MFVLKWRPLANSVIVALLADVFSSIPQIARHFRRAIRHSPDFFKREALLDCLKPVLCCVCFCGSTIVNELFKYSAR